MNVSTTCVPDPIQAAVDEQWREAVVAEQASEPAFAPTRPARFNPAAYFRALVVAREIDAVPKIVIPTERPETFAEIQALMRRENSGAGSSSGARGRSRSPKPAPVTGTRAVAPVGGDDLPESTTRLQTEGFTAGEHRWLTIETGRARAILLDYWAAIDRGDLAPSLQRDFASDTMPRDRRRCRIEAYLPEGAAAWLRLEPGLTRRILLTAAYARATERIRWRDKA